MLQECEPAAEAFDIDWKSVVADKWLDQSRAVDKDALFRASCDVGGDPRYVGLEFDGLGFRRRHRAFRLRSAPLRATTPPVRCPPVPEPHRGNHQDLARDAVEGHVR